MADAPGWSWETETKRYRDNSSGRFLSHETVRDLRDDYLTALKAEPVDLAAQLASGDLSLRQWEAGMRDHIRATFVAQALLGCGGENAATPAVYGVVGAQVKAQYGFLRGFAQEIAAGTLSDAQISTRAQLYTASATQAYERARAGSFEVTLPQYPGDGSQDCKANCNCSWEIVETADEIRATWQLGGTDHCETCEQNATQWAPLVFEKGSDRMIDLPIGNGRHTCNGRH